MTRPTGHLSILSAYFAVVLVAFGCIALGLVAVVTASAGLPQQGPQERTLLDFRVESAREIRQALAKPVPPPERLPPITAQLARSLEVAAKPERRKLSQDARDAFASTEWSAQSQSNASTSLDRHTSNF